jgi:hypothetical protein
MPTCCISVRKINHCDIETVCISTLSKCKEDLSHFQNILFSLSAPTEHNASWEERSKPEVLCKICGGVAQWGRGVAHWSAHWTVDVQSGV